MHLHISKEVFDSAVCARLVGWALGIIYWVISVTCLAKESLVMLKYYCRYLPSQDVNSAEQVQVVETIFSCLTVIIITIFLAVEKIVLMSITFVQEKSLLTPHISANCQHKKWQKKKLN